MSTPVQNADGKWVIPASQRPDGTWRKEIFVKEGFVVSFLIVKYLSVLVIIIIMYVTI